METLGAAQPLDEGKSARGLRPWLMVGPWAACVAVAILMFLVVGPVTGGYGTAVLQKIGVFIIAAVGLNIVNGYAGQFSIGHAGFMAVGGYVAAATTYYGSLYFFGESRPEGFLHGGVALMLLGVGLGALVAAGFGYVVGLPSLRLRGDYLAIVTLGFGEIIRVLLTQTSRQIYSAQEFRDRPLELLATFPFNGALGFERVPQYANLFWVFLLASMTCLVAFRVKYSSAGRAFLSIREDEIAARAMGVNLTKYKVRAFVLAALFGGVAGGVWAHAGQNFSPTEAGFQRSFDIVILVVLGGMGSISGAVIAAVVLTTLTEVLRGPEQVLNSWWMWGAMAIAFGVVAAILAARKRPGAGLLFLAAATPIALLAFALVAERVKAWTGVSLGDYRMVLYALALILVMILRPNGLFGVGEAWDYFGRVGASRRRGRKGAAA